jgi:hypothetical protein
VLTRLQLEAQANPANAELRALLSDLRSLPGVPAALEMASLATFQPGVLLVAGTLIGSTDWT